MLLSRIEPRNNHSEKRTFGCPRCAYIKTVIAADPLQSREFVRLTERVWPPN
jgi:hypothetical protein